VRTVDDVIEVMGPTHLPGAGFDAALARTRPAAEARAGGPAWKVAAVAAVVALPLVGLATLTSEPAIDHHWHHEPTHFWLILVAAIINAGVGYAMGAAARVRADARVFLVSMGFLAAAGFLGLHALATPGVLLDGPNPGFVLATRIGLVVVGLFLAGSAVPMSAGRAAAIVRRAGAVRVLVLGLIAGWAVLSLLGLPPLDGRGEPDPASGPLVGLVVVGLGLYLWTAVRYAQIYRHRPGPLPLSLLVASLLLGEVMVALAFGQRWHASWWGWHVVMLIAFGLVAASAHRQWHEERFSSLYRRDTAASTREVSVVFADLQGFSSFAERHDPQEVSAMLNAYFQVIIPPIVRRLGGVIDRIIGDALMVVFNERGDQPDHAERAVRAAAAIQEATAAVVREHPAWPRFRVGVNSGDAHVGLLGTVGGRTFTVIGDTVNVAARLEGLAPVGGVALGPRTVDLVPGVDAELMGRMAVRGRTEAVDVYRLVGAPRPGAPPRHRRDVPEVSRSM
jgi:adenylate cyclase